MLRMSCEHTIYLKLYDICRKYNIFTIPIKNLLSIFTSLYLIKIISGMDGQSQLQIGNVNKKERIVSYTSIRNRIH